jgi:hypothetical protein
MSPSVLSADHEIPRKVNENKSSSVGGLLVNLAAHESQNATRTPADDEASTISPAPNDKYIGTILPAATGTEAGTTPGKPTNPKQTGTPTPDQPAAHSSESSSSPDDTQDEKYVSCFLEWLVLHLDYKIMLDDKIKMLVHNKRKMGKTRPYRSSNKL